MPDAAEYSRQEIAIIWNSDARSVNVRWSFTASTPEAAEQRVREMLDYEAARIKQ